MKFRNMLTMMLSRGGRFPVATGTKDSQTVDDIGVSVAVKGASDDWPSGSDAKKRSQKTITAWACLVKARYADASTRSHSGTVDVISDLGARQGLAFRSASAVTFEDSLPLGAKWRPAHPAPLPTLTMVVFNDDTAIGDPVQIRRFSAGTPSPWPLVRLRNRTKWRKRQDSSPRTPSEQS